MGYQKKIAYLDYLENGMKIKNAGFVKAEENNGQMRLEIRVKNIPNTFSGEYELSADVGGTIGRISISRGCGSSCIVWKNGTKVPDNRRRIQANGVYIRLPGRHLLQAVWADPLELQVEHQGEEELQAVTKEEVPADSGKIERIQQKTENEKAGEAKMAEPAESTQAAETAKAAEAAKTSGTTQATEAVQSAETARPAEKTGAVETAKSSETPETTETMETMRPARENGAAQAAEQPETEEKDNSARIQGDHSAQMPPVWNMEFMPDLQINSNDDSADQEPESGQETICYGDKWEQLCSMYPAIHPFRDEREYLSIAPKDFVVLRQEYQKMVHNSFLLHGYYNYKHLILGKIKEKEEWKYYLGVPGNFYRREKMVAEMFGFEAFEGEKSPASPGDFGYFMKRVEI